MARSLPPQERQAPPADVDAGDAASFDRPVHYIDDVIIFRSLKMNSIKRLLVAYSWYNKGYTLKESWRRSKYTHI